LGIYQRHVLPRIVNKVCGREEFTTSRVRTVEGLAGNVVEIGFGSGHNLAHYPPDVDGIVAVEPSLLARRLAAPRIAATAIDVEFVDLDGDRLPLPDGSADAVVSTFTLCTIADLEPAFSEIRRIMRPGATFHFAEHGLAPDPRVARWQHRLTPIQRRLAGGCHFDRPIADLVASNGFEITSLENYYLKGPKFGGYIYRGVARAG
jgi:ubiquinone/menaquinone biosynthesis C-methylase UbiE